MAANKFATMLHRSTHRMAAILVYTLLEWILIALILLNALFSYLISKFAAFFGLHPPCLFCNRVDRLFESGRTHRDMLCDDHAAEVSRLGYCSHHRRLAEAADMCEDCAPEPADRTVALLSWMKRSEAGEKDIRCSCCGVALESGFYSPYLVLKPDWGVLGVTKKGNSVDEGSEEGSEGEDLLELKDREEPGGDDVALLSYAIEQEDVAAVVLSSGTSVSVEDTSIKILALSSKNIDDVAEGRLVPVELIDSATMMEKPVEFWPSGEGDGGIVENSVEMAPPEQISALISFIEIEDMSFPKIVEMVDSLEKSSMEEAAPVSFVEIEDRSFPKIVEMVDSLEKSSMEEEAAPVSFVEIEDRSFPKIVEMIDSLEKSLMEEEEAAPVSFVEIEDRSCSKILETVSSLEKSSKEQMAALVSYVGVEDISSSKVLEMVDIVEDHPLVPHVEGSIGNTDHQCVFPRLLDAIPQHSIDVKAETVPAAEDSGEVQGSEDESKTLDCDAHCEISIGSEICDQENFDQSHLLEPAYVPATVETPCAEEYSKTTDRGHQVIEAEPMEPLLRGVDRLSICPELNEVDEDRVPETPTSVDGIHSVHKRFFFERRESGTESFDGSVASEIEGGETLTVDRLKSALKSERNALSALYAELEEERSASAIAANQTMAMITRLQEEKAAMRMEALQYQRMMEEQSEYDQEALQLLNELMMKREKEKQELEKDMEVYRKKVFFYEAKERRKIAGSKASGRSETSSPSSTAEDSDGHSFDFHEGDDCFNSLDESNQNTPTESILSSGVVHESAKHLIPLDESLDEFEEERVSILEQLKALEEKLFTLDEEEPSSTLESVEVIEANGHGVNGDYEALGKYENIVVNGFSDDLDAGKVHSEQKSMMGYRGKRLLPLFDAISLENDDGLPPEQNETDSSPKSVSKFTMDHKKLAIAEEVNNVYERLQALEADREFLKHCVSSLKKGDKGMDLLQEILQHLRDLRNVEFRARNVSDAEASFLA